MKTILSILLLGSLVISTASAQSNADTDKTAISINEITPPSIQTGNTNYLLSLSQEDLKNNKYVLCTDSNATVAYLTINGIKLRLPGGPNAEHIMAYVGNGYTVTLSTETVKTIADNSDDSKNLHITATLVVYAKDGQTVVKKVTGTQINRVKN